MSTNSNHRQVIGEVREDLQEWARLALSFAQASAVNYARGESTGMIQPGARIRTSESGSTYYWYSPSLPVRRAHPGGWADVTGLTSNLYGMEEPTIQGNQITGSIFNTAEHAEDLEGKLRIGRGGNRRYWVVAGLAGAGEFENEFDLAGVFRQKFNELVEDDNQAS